MDLSKIPRTFAEIPEHEQAILYLTASPAGVDFGTQSDSALSARLREFREFPENLRRLLFAEETAWKLYRTAVVSHQLSREQTEELARILRAILIGEESAAQLQTIIGTRLTISPAVAESIAKQLTQEFITPNYFQISQVYEKRRGKVAGAPLRPAGQGRQDSGETPGEKFPALSLEQPRAAAPPRVVDLRNGVIPKRLPATPPMTPLTETRNAPPDHLGADTPPPTPPTRGGPSADDLLKTFRTRPAPSGPSGGPRNGSHGPLPSPLTER